MTDPEILQNFNGKARLFPLPNLVIFPHIVQPLHVFEPRYRQLVGDALEHDRLLALALLQPGWEEDYEGRPAIHPIACLGRIVAEHQLADGRYNLLLRGISRVRIEHELPDSKLYRTARVQLVPDILPTLIGEASLRQRLLEAVPGWFPDQQAISDKIQSVLGGELPVGALCNVIAFALALDTSARQTLLAEADVERRVQLLFELTSKPAIAPEKAARKFPPDFSAN